MAAFTSKATGNWSATGSTTWTTAGTPGNGDTVTIANTHVVTVDVNTTIGSSPSNTTTFVITIAAGGTLIVAGGVTFTVRGNVTVGGSASAVAGGIFRQAAGSIVEMDNSQATTKTIQYIIRINTLTQTGTVPKYEINGTSGSTCILRSNSGGGNARFSTTTSGGDGAWITAAYCAFTRIGSTTNNFMSPVSNSNTAAWSFTNCTFDACGPINWSPSNTDASFTLTDCSFTNHVANSRNLTIVTGAARTGGARIQILRNNFDAGIGRYPDSWECEDNVITMNTDTDDLLENTAWTTFKRNLFILTASGANQINSLTTSGDMTDCYVLLDNANGNPHVLSPAASFAGYTYSGLLWEYTGATMPIDSGDAILADTGPSSFNVKNCIMIPMGNQAAGDPPCTFINCGTGAYTVTNNTFDTSAICGMYQGDYVSAVGLYPVVKSNVAWAQRADATGTAYFIQDPHNTATPASTTNDVLTATGCKFNVQWGLDEGYQSGGYNVRTTTAPGVGDCNLRKGGVGPGFLDITRNIATWALTRGSTSTTYTNRKNDALTYLRADRTLIYSSGDNSLIQWVRKGFSPTKNVTKLVAHDGGNYRGAVPYTTPTDRRHQYRRNAVRGS